MDAWIAIGLAYLATRRAMPALGASAAVLRLRAQPEYRTLRPELQQGLDRIADELARKGIPIQIVPRTGGARTWAQQAAEYAKGRTVKSPVGPYTVSKPLGATVTNAPPGQSPHTTLGDDGKPLSAAVDVFFGDWERPRDKNQNDQDDWLELELAAGNTGLETLARAGDYGHIQLPNWRALPQPKTLG